MKFQYKTHKGGAHHVVDVGHRIKGWLFPSWVEAEDKVVTLTAQVKAFKESDKVFVIDQKYLKEKTIELNVAGSMYLEINKTMIDDTKFVVKGMKLQPKQSYLTLFGQCATFSGCTFFTE